MRKKTILSRYKGMLWLMGTAGFCLPAQAARAPMQPVTQATDTIRQPARSLNTVEVNARKAEQDNRTIASQTLSREQFDRQGITDLADALRRLAGTNVRDYGGAGGMKTLSVRSMGATHTAVIYDGIGVTDCESGQIDLSRFSLEQVDELTLTVGDNADIFVPARNLASAAALRLSTAAPTFGDGKRFQVRTQIKAGSFGLVNPMVNYEQALGRQWSLRARTDYLRADNQYPFTLTNVQLVTREKRYNNAIRTGNGELNVYYRPEEGAQRMDAKVYYYEAYKQLPGQVVYYNPVNNEDQRFKNLFGQASYRIAFPCRLSLQANAKANWSETHYRELKPQYAEKEKNNYYRQQEYYASATLLYTPLEGLSLSAAADYAYTTLRSDAIDCKDPLRHTALASLAAKYRIAGLTATATVLLSNYRHDVKEGKSAQDARHVSPSVGLAYCPPRVAWLCLRASYKDIFRMPTFSDNYYTQLGNRDLNPETTQQFNLGVTLQAPDTKFLRGAQVEADVYRNNVKDKIVAMPINTFFWNMVNLGKVDIWGADAKLTATWLLGRRLQLETNLNYTFQYAVDVTEPGGKYYKDQIAYTPRHSGGASVALLTPWVNLILHGTAMTKRYSTNQNMDITRIEPHHELGVAAWRRFDLRGTTALELRADVMNLTDEQYDIVRLYPMPGRAWKLTLTIHI